METTSVLEVTGKVAGLGGLSLGVLLLIFRDVIRRNIFPNLAQVQAYRIIRLVVVLTFAIASLGIAASVYVMRSDRTTVVDDFPQKNPITVMQSHLALIDDEKYSDAYQALAQEAKKRIQPALFSELFENERKPKGKALNRSMRGATPMQQLPDGTHGPFEVAQFVTQFENGGQYIEVLTTIAERGEWKMMFHQIFPCSTPYCSK